MLTAVDFRLARHPRRMVTAKTDLSSRYEFRNTHATPDEIEALGQQAASQISARQMGKLGVQQPKPCFTLSCERTRGSPAFRNAR